MIDIIEVNSDKDMKDFLQFPFALYRNCSEWVPPITKEEKAVFDKQNSTTSVDVTQIIERENNITVIIENIDKGISQDISHPFHIVKMTKTNKPITFIKE